MTRRRKRTYSRLSARERKRYTRQTVLFSFLTILLIIAIIVWGIPSLVKVAIFLGDLRSSSQPISGEDTIPPPPPVFQPILDATNSAQIRVEGFAEEGSTVIISVNNSEVAEVIVESDGEFLVNNLELEGGENRISASAIDSSGNKSHPSSTHRVRYDANPPTLEITAPENRSTFYGQQERITQVRGSAEPGSQVLINDSFVILSQDGSFSHNITLETGENTITVIARDRAGNEIVEKIKVNYEE